MKRSVTAAGSLGDGFVETKKQRLTAVVAGVKCATIGKTVRRLFLAAVIAILHQLVSVASRFTSGVLFHFFCFLGRGDNFRWLPQTRFPVSENQ